MITLAQYLSQVSVGVLDTDLIGYIGKYQDLFPQLNLYGAPNHTTQQNIKTKNTKIYCKYRTVDLVKRPLNGLDSYKSVTTPRLVCVYFDDGGGPTPIAILRTTERYEDKHRRVLLIDELGHRSASGYLFSLLQEDPGPETEIGFYRFSGDLLPHVQHSMNLPYLNLGNSTDYDYVEHIINYTIDPLDL